MKPPPPQMEEACALEASMPSRTIQQDHVRSGQCPKDTALRTVLETIVSSVAPGDVPAAVLCYPQLHDRLLPVVLGTSTMARLPPLEAAAFRTLSQTLRTGGAIIALGCIHVAIESLFIPAAHIAVALLPEDTMPPPSLTVLQGLLSLSTWLVLTVILFLIIMLATPRRLSPPLRYGLAGFPTLVLGGLVCCLSPSLIFPEMVQLPTPFTLLHPRLSALETFAIVTLALIAWADKSFIRHPNLTQWLHSVRLSALLQVTMAATTLLSSVLFPLSGLAYLYFTTGTAYASLLATAARPLGEKPFVAIPHHIAVHDGASLQSQRWLLPVGCIAVFGTLLGTWDVLSPLQACAAFIACTTAIVYYIAPEVFDAPVAHVCPCGVRDAAPRRRFFNSDASPALRRR